MSTEAPVKSENLIADAIDAAEDIRNPLDGLVEKTALCARRIGAACGTEERAPRGVRGVAGEAEDCWLDIAQPVDLAEPCSPETTRMG